MRLTTCRWSDSRSTRGTKACSPRNIPSPSHRTSGLSAITRQTSERLGKLFGCSSVKTMTYRTPIGLQPFSRQLAKMFLLVLPGIDHISLTLDPVAIQAAIAAVESMDHEKPNQTMQT